ncbi:MAG: elongation factor P, partial [Patescibacteria group bacterium]
GNTLEKTFQGAEKADEAETEVKKANFMYKDKEEAYFMDNADFEQFSLSLESIGEKENYLKEGTDVNVLYFNDKPVSIDLPIKMDFKVVSAPPSVRGNSAGNVNKQVELETGALLNVPLFINEGDIVRINTDSGEYVERA